MRMVVCFKNLICLFLSLCLGATLVYGAPQNTTHFKKVRTPYEQHCKNNLAKKIAMYGVMATTSLVTSVPVGIMATGAFERFVIKSSLFPFIISGPVGVLVGGAVGYVATYYVGKATCAIIRWVERTKEDQVSFVMEDVITGQTSHHHCLVAKTTNEENSAFANQGEPIFNTLSLESQVLRILPSTCVTI